MHEHQFDLIAATADGTASPEEAVLAERAVADCEACAEEFRLQNEILEVLRSAPPAVMTDLERAALHRSLTAATKPARAPGWYRRYAPRIAAVAAGFAVVGLASVAMLGQLGGDTAETFNEISSPSGDESSAADTAEAPMVGEGLLQDLDVSSTEEPVPASADDAGGTEEMAADGSDDSTFYRSVALLPENLETLLAGDVPIEMAEQFDVALESFSILCPDVAPDPELTEVAAEVTFDGEAAYVLVYSSESARFASAYAIPSCETLAEATDKP